MKTCPACGLHVEDDYLYCWEDGTRLSGGETLVLPQRPTAPPTVRPTVPIDLETLSSPVPSVAEAVDEQRVLSCPVCGGEFPLTFTACPVHNLPLSSKRASRKRAFAPAATALVTEPIADLFVHEEAIQPNDTVEDSELGIAEETDRCHDEPYVAEEKTQTREAGRNTTGLASRPWPGGVGWEQLRDHARALWQRIAGRARGAHGRTRSMDWGFGLSASVDSHQTAPSPGMRIAARATAIALALFTVGALYLFYRQVSRAPSRSTRGAAVQSGDARVESPLIATPSEAREYREEPAPAAQAAAGEEATDPATSKQTAPYTAANDVSVPRTNTPPYARSAPASQPPIQSGASDSLPPSASGRFNAQLVRVRSYKAPSGYTYALTFTLYEHAGRPMKWERLSIVTHSASGATHTEMLPFQRWLAGSGALTFTLNVDMVGASEADWRGRISCMSVGADETGRPLRASFGTDVAP